MRTPEARVLTPLHDATMAGWEGAIRGGLAGHGSAAHGSAAHGSAAHGSAARAPLAAADVTRDQATHWSRRGLRWLRDLAIGMTIIAAIPLLSIAVGEAPNGLANGTRERLAQAERLRPLRVAADPGIAPFAAGEALHRLAPATGSAAFPVRVVTPDALPWRTGALPASLFPSIRSSWWPGPAVAQVISAAQAGFTADEMQWLKTLADAPLWRDVSLVARAQRVDVYGARLASPLPAGAATAFPPFLSIRTLREIGEAGVARAAYFVATGDVAKAEASLREIVSLGFAIMDNGVTLAEAYTGRIMVDIGRNGLHQLASTPAYAHLRTTTAPFPTRSVRVGGGLANVGFDLVRDINDPALPRSARFELVGLLPYSSCSSLRYVLWGYTGRESAALAQATRALPRFDTERQLLASMTPRDGATAQWLAPQAVVDQVIQGAAALTAVATGNERIATCALVTRLTRRGE